MTLVRATTILAAATGAIDPRWRLTATGLQIAKTPPWSKKPMTIRNVPYTAVMPKPKQLAVRIAFGRIASQAKGRKKTGFLPPAAELVAQAKGRIAQAAAGIPSQRDTRRNYHTLSELEEMARRMGITVAI
jgi:hypothetical protein